MKKLLLISILSLGILASTNAQESNFGFKLGLNLSNIVGDDSGDPDSRAGLHIGGYANLGLTDVFALRPELLYSMKGAEDLTLSYLDIPVLGKYNVTEELSLLLGPQLGILLAADNDGTDVDDFYKTADFGLVIGGNYELETGLNFGIRYNPGLSSIGEEREEPTFGPNGIPTGTRSYTPEIRNSTLMLSIGYSL